jgi:hypothetical protein
MVVSS